ncbi:zinc ribbon domain-containing protein [Xanthomonas arboricola]|uniref:zinc ribbon domain-containing protein n=1 Tax=Xanthomonas arboricola TaxID=56448 RepID=UPI001290671C|nr:zinc ribbon domain-containing protein [Xanthomonas arboricola]
MKISADAEFEATLQQRADYIPLEDLQAETSKAGDLFNVVHAQLINKALRTIVGPRGCGKTHMMRYAWLMCSKTQSHPFAVYASFNRYFRLEPLLSSRSSALHHFHSWVLARLVIATWDAATNWPLPQDSIDAIFEECQLDVQALATFASRLERNQPLDEIQSSLSESLSIERVQSLIDLFKDLAGRRWSVILMDDAALTLTPEYLLEFLDIVRSLKSVSISPKVSVYPGTTEVSPKFHQGQDAVSIPVWLCIEDPAYVSVMDQIAQTRVKSFGTIPKDVRSLLRFAAFGIPRAYLTMLDEYDRGGYRTSQQAANQIISDHYQARVDEYTSLGVKVPKLEGLVDSGKSVLEGIAKEIKAQNAVLVEKGRKQLTYGVQSDELTPMVARMFSLLIEAGLVYDNGGVKHGTPERIYRRFIPHSGALLGIRAFSTGPGGSIRQTLNGIELRSSKHPVRKSLARAIPEVQLDALTLSLPRCAKCNNRRLSDSQLFCHICGNQLVDASTFTKCLDVAISAVPGLTSWQRVQIATHLPALRTIRDFLAKQDPAADLLRVRGFGDRRTARIVDVLNGFVDDYLS